MKTLLQLSILAFTFTLLCPAVSEAQIDISDDGSGTGTVTWTADNEYILHGFVFVNDGQTLTIEPGTVIKGAPGTGANAAALIVARGGKIMAEGTAENPIVFTFENDPLDGSVPYDTRGQWGGLIILGKGKLNSVPGESAVEGIPTSETRGLYGGDDDNDNSGILKYVSIRHGGTDIGAGNEINGLTLGGVGAATIIDYIEIFSNNDDGIEFFGGKPNVKHALVAFCADDSFDYDEGFRGNGQFWVAIQDVEGGVGDRGGEHDGGTDPEDGQPYATPTISNATYIGRGTDAGKRLLTFRDNAGGYYYNSVFVNWAKGVDIEKLNSGEDAYTQFENDRLMLKNNLFWDVVSAGGSASPEELFKVSFGSGIEDSGESDQFAASFLANGNATENPGLAYETVSPGEGGLQLVPSGEAINGAEMPADEWFETVDYKGAFAPNDAAWVAGWTYLDQLGFLTGIVDGIEEHAIFESRVYPNPANAEIHIETGEYTGMFEIEMHDVSGQLVRKEQFNNPTGTITLDTNNMHKGMYILTLRKNKAARSYKVFIR